MAMKLTRETWIALGLFIVVLALHMFLSMQMETLDSDAYFILRQADTIRETGAPVFDDPLSYSGRTLIFQPLFHYFVAFFSIFLATAAAAKLTAAISFAIATVLVYLISKHITKNKWVSLIAAGFSALTPALYLELSNPTPTSLGLAITLALAYSFLRLEDEHIATYAIILVILSLLTSADLLIFIIGILFYFIMLFLENTPASRKEGEMTIFIFFLAVWFNILVYKRAFFNSGVSTLWANLPAGLLSTYFQDITFVGLIYSVGIIPLILGVYAIFNLMFENKIRSVQLFIGLAIASFSALWLRMVPINTGLLFFSTSMIILSAHTMKTAHLASQKTKFSALPKILTALVLILFFITTLPGLFSLNLSEPQNKADLEAMEWIRENTPEDATVLAMVDEGFMINYIAGRKNVADSNFLFLANSEEAYQDVQMLYTLRLTSEAIRLLNKYHINYILISTKAETAREGSMQYLEDDACFEKVFDSQATVYRFKGCQI